MTFLKKYVKINYNQKKEEVSKMEFKGIMNRLENLTGEQLAKERSRRGIDYCLGDSFNIIKQKIAYAEGYNVARSESGNPSYKEKRVNVLIRDNIDTIYPVTLTESQLRVLDFIRDEMDYDLNYDIVNDFEII